MGKKFSITLVLLVLTLLLAMGGCGRYIAQEDQTTAPLKARETYSDASFFPELTAIAKIDAPAGWTREWPNDESVLVYYTKDQAVISLNQSYAMEDTSLADLVKYEKEQLEDDELDREALQFLMADEIPYREEDQDAFAYSMTLGGQTYKTWCVFLREGTSVFLLRCTAPAAEFDSYENLFGLMVASLQVVKE